ncbi:MAG: methyltransferase domain-containing protein [Bacteroidota bacterium]
MKSSFSNRDISDYYDQTEIHYRYFWDLNTSKALHYGFWKPGTQDFRASLENTNREMAILAGIKKKDRVLDAGCGVGGSSIFLASELGCEVVGITLSEKQVASAVKNAERSEVSNATFFKKDYCDTGFEDASFDCVWALESVGSASDKENFLKEAHRLLKPGGRMVIADYFKTFEAPIDQVPVMKNWLNAWAISDLETLSGFEELLAGNGFFVSKKLNRTKAITPSSKRMYKASWLGMLGTKTYNLFKNASPFSKIHYRSGIAQYRALKKGLWDYHVLLTFKRQDIA